MSESQQDLWAKWLLNRRFSGDSKRMELALTTFLLSRT